MKAQALALSALLLPVHGFAGAFCSFGETTEWVDGIEMSSITNSFELTRLPTCTRQNEGQIMLQIGRYIETRLGRLDSCLGQSSQAITYRNIGYNYLRCESGAWTQICAAGAATEEYLRCEAQSCVEDDGSFHPAHAAFGVLITGKKEISSGRNSCTAEHLAKIGLFYDVRPSGIPKSPVPIRFSPKKVGSEIGAISLSNDQASEVDAKE
jgi:hypothetical protein